MCCGFQSVYAGRLSGYLQRFWDYRASCNTSIDQLKTLHQTAVKLSSHPNIQPTTYPACRLSDCPKSFVGRQQGAQESNTEPRTCNRAARRWSIELVPGRFQQLQPVSASFTPVYASLRHFVQTRPNCFSPRYASLRQFTPV